MWENFSFFILKLYSAFMKSGRQMRKGKGKAFFSFLKGLFFKRRKTFHKAETNTDLKSKCKCYTTSRHTVRSELTGQTVCDVTLSTLTHI